MMTDWFDVYSEGGVDVKNNTTPLERTAADGARAVVSFGGQTASVTADISQQAGRKVYGAMVFKLITATKIPASGGRASDCVSFTIEQPYTWNGVADTGGVETYTRQQLPAGITLIFTGDVAVTSLGATVKAETKITTLTVKVARSVVGGGTATASIDVMQAANTVTYAVPTVSLTVGDIPAGGGIIQRGTVSYSQVATYTSGARSTITTGGTVSYSSAVAAATLGIIPKVRTKVGTFTATVVLNGKSGSKTIDVYQAANEVETYGAPYTRNFTVTSTGQGHALGAYIWQRHDYTSGATTEAQATNLTNLTYELLGGTLGTIAQSGGTGGLVVEQDAVGDALVRASMVADGKSYALDIIVFGPPPADDECGVVIYELGARFANYQSITTAKTISSSYDLDRGGVSVQGFNYVKSISGVGISKVESLPYLSKIELAANASGRVVFSQIEETLDVVVYINLTPP